MNHILTESIWFLWSKTSYSGYKRQCHQAGRTNERTREDRATQPLVCWKAEFRNKDVASQSRFNLPAKALGLCELGHSVAVKIYVKVGHLSNLVPHCLLCTVHLPECERVKIIATTPGNLGSELPVGAPNTVLFQLALSQDLNVS